MMGSQQGPQLGTPTLLTPALTFSPLLSFHSTRDIFLVWVSSVMLTFPGIVSFFHQNLHIQPPNKPPS